MQEPMTRKRLEQYLKDQADVDRLGKLASEKVQDKVRGSMAEYPYTEMGISVTGLDVRLVHGYQQKKSQAEAERAAVVAFVEELEDLYMADLIRKRYLERKTWVDIWKAYQCCGSVDAYRVMVRRFLEKL